MSDRGLVLAVLWPVLWSTHLLLTPSPPQPAVLLSWLRSWVVVGLLAVLETLVTSKVGEQRTPV